MLSDRVIFHLKRLWSFDPENLPSEDAICARCGHAFKQHLFSGELRSCVASVKVESFRGVSFFKRCSCSHFMVDLYKEIKEGRKTGEWRNASHYWLSILFKGWEVREMLHSDTVKGFNKPVDVTEYLKVKRAWLLVGFPKGNVPRLEADITQALYYPSSWQFLTKFNNVTEILHA